MEVFWILWSVFKTTTKLYSLFFLSAMLSGELLYRKTKKNKSSLAIRKKAIVMTNPPFEVKKLLNDIHHNLTFDYIYIRVSGFKFRGRELFNLIYGFVFIYITGVSRLTITLISSAIKIRPNNLSEFLLAKFGNDNTDQLLIAKEGVWHKNNRFKVMVETLETWCLHWKIEPKQFVEMRSALEEIHVKYDTLQQRCSDKPLEFAYARLKYNPDVSYHRYMPDITKDPKTGVWLTDQLKAVKHQNYGDRPVFNQLMMQKPTVGLAKSKEDLIIPSSPKLVKYYSKYKLIVDANKYGCDMDLIDESIKNDIEVLNEIDHAFEMFKVKYGADRELVETLQSHFFNIDY